MKDNAKKIETEFSCSNQKRVSCEKSAFGKNPVTFLEVNLIFIKRAHPVGKSLNFEQKQFVYASMEYA